MAKTFVEMANEAATILINKGMITVPPLTKQNTDWKERNAETVRTYGWAVLELYKELLRVPKKAMLEDLNGKKDGKKKGSLIVTR